jgi:hypothetical protein
MQLKGAMKEEKTAVVCIHTHLHMFVCKILIENLGNAAGYGGSYF